MLITSDPSGAATYINGKLIGYTPVIWDASIVPFKEFTITLKKKGYREITRVIKADIPAMTWFGKFPYGIGLLLLGAGFVSPTITRSIPFIISSLPMIALSLSLPQRLHFLLPDEKGNTHITHLPGIKYSFPVSYFSSSSRFPITVITKNYVDSQGRGGRIILGKRYFMLDAGALIDVVSGEHYQQISFTYFPSLKFSFSLVGITRSLKWYGIGGRFQFIFPLWNGDVLQSIQLRTGIEGEVLKDTDWLSISTNLDYRLTYTTTIILSISTGYDFDNQKHRIVTGFGVGFLL